MKKTFLFALCILVFCSEVFCQSSSELGETINAFLATLTADEEEQASYEFNDSLRTQWTNLPLGLAERPGIRYGDLSETSKIQFHHILTTLFSSQGYLKTNNIMHLDDYLLEIYEIAHQRGQMNEETIQQLRSLNWGHGNYYVSVWGAPKPDENWAFKFEGHHISLNVTSVDGLLSTTPLFFGSDPALVRVTQFAGIRPLSKEEDYGLELFHMLSPEQQSVAVFSKDFPRDIITAPGEPQRLTEFQGIKGSALTDPQKQQLKYLILEYLTNFERERSGYYMDKLMKGGVDNIYFGWIGGKQRETNHYYVIHGPDFLIEYDNAGWIYEGDHIHTIFRDKRDDFGEDLLKTHYRQHQH